MPSMSSMVSVPMSAGAVISMCSLVAACLALVISLGSLWMRKCVV